MTGGTHDMRPIEASDGPALHAVLGHPEVSRWLRPKGVTEPLSLAECETMARSRAAQWEAFAYGEWLVLDGETPVARGGLNHTVVDGRAEVELGWAVAPSHQRQGLAIDLARKGLAVAQERGIRGVVAYTRADNEPSRRVAERVGLRLERAFGHAGYPHVLYRAP